MQTSPNSLSDTSQSGSLWLVVLSLLLIESILYNHRLPGWQLQRSNLLFNRNWSHFSSSLIPSGRLWENAFFPPLGAGEKGTHLLFHILFQKKRCSNGANTVPRTVMWKGDKRWKRCGPWFLIPVEEPLCLPLVTFSHYPQEDFSCHLSPSESCDLSCSLPGFKQKKIVTN